MAHTTLIAPQELELHFADPDWVVFDCRHQLTDRTYGHRVYAEGHLPGARFADMDGDLAAPVTPGSGRHPLPEMEAFARWLGRQGVGERSQVVAYDDGPGAMAARLWWMVRYLGHPAVAVLDGGMGRWRKEGRPLSADVPRPQPARFTPRIDTRALAPLEEVERVSRDSRRILIDARGAERFEGRTEPIDPVAGHIPGAINLPYPENLAPEGTFLSPERLRARFERVLGGADPAATIHYCGSGVSACHNLLAMAVAGLPAGRLYVGSWSQWCADPARPVATGPSPQSRSTR